MDDNEVKPCERCGACCKTNLFAYVEKSDLERWKQEGRSDILDIIDNTAPVWAGDRLVSSKTGRGLENCPFFKWTGERGGCAIYVSRPRVCRDYNPGENEMCPQFGRGGSKKKGKIWSR